MYCDRRKKSDCLDKGGMLHREGLESWITKRDKDTFGRDGFVYYLAYGDSVIGP